MNVSNTAFGVTVWGPTQRLGAADKWMMVIMLGYVCEAPGPGDFFQFDFFQKFTNQLFFQFDFFQKFAN